LEIQPDLGNSYPKLAGRAYYYQLPVTATPEWLAIKDLFCVPDLPIRIGLAAERPTLQFCHLFIAFTPQAG
jgi:hypothetical protein